MGSATRHEIFVVVVVVVNAEYFFKALVSYFECIEYITKGSQSHIPIPNVTNIRKQKIRT